MDIKDIKETKEILEYLEKRQLLKQYKKAKRFIISWHPELADLKIREPKDTGIYYFRINKQFRVLWVIRQVENKETWEIENIFFIADISNHQN